jgi:PAS domain-containing protein
LTRVHPADRERAQHGWEGAVRAAAPFELDCRIRRFDGEFRWHRLRSVPARGVDGHVVKWMGTATDIDDHKQLEEALRLAHREASQRLELLEALHSSAPLGFGMVDQESRVITMNERLAALNGAPVEDQLGRTVAELVPELWPQIEVALRHVRDTGDPVTNLEVRLTGPLAGTDDGWLVSCYPVRRHEEILGVGVVTVTITGQSTNYS